jgi:hypothetical protein
MCGLVLEKDMFLCLWKVLFWVEEGREEIVIGCYWLTDGTTVVVLCFLSHRVAHDKRYDGVLTWVTCVLCANETKCSRETGDAAMKQYCQSCQR